jgi:hypothetical protein
MNLREIWWECADWIYLDQDKDQWWAVVNTVMSHPEIGWEGVDWIHLAQDKDQWRAVLNTVMNVRVP